MTAANDPAFPLPCWACEALAGSTAHGAFTPYYDDGEVAAFLVPGAVPVGMSMVLPRRHVEDFAHDMTIDEYLDVQAVVHRAASALKHVTAVGALTVTTTGGMPGSPHTAWNLMPMTMPAMGPDGPLPYPELDAASLAESAARLRRAMAPGKF